MSNLEYIAIFILLFDFIFHVKPNNTAVAEHVPENVLAKTPLCELCVSYENKSQ